MIKKLIKGLRCEECNNQYSENPVYDWESDLYVYLDLSGATRCFCRKHMTFFNKNGSMQTYKDKDVRIGYGAKSITEVLKK